MSFVVLLIDVRLRFQSVLERTIQYPHTTLKWTFNDPRLSLEINSKTHFILHKCNIQHIVYILSILKSTFTCQLLTLLRFEMWINLPYLQETITFVETNTRKEED